MRVPLLFYVVISVHVIAAITWVGGMLFLGVVGAPALRAIEPPALRQQLFRSLGIRFRGIGWAAILLLGVIVVMAAVVLTRGG